MKWPWARDRRVYIDLRYGQDAAQARRDAEARWGEVRAVIDDHARIRERNHFAQRLAAAYGRSPQS